MSSQPNRNPSPSNAPAAAQRPAIELSDLQPIDDPRGGIIAVLVGLARPAEPLTGIRDGTSNTILMGEAVPPG